MANCDGVTPAGVVDGTGHVPAVGDFCWQQTGIPRVGSPVAPSLNVDPTRNGIEPDIAFTGAQDAVPWVVWYETGRHARWALQQHQRDGVRGQGRQRRRCRQRRRSTGVAVGNGGQGNLDASINGAGTCASSLATEQACSLNVSPTADAEDPRVASGTMNPANPTVPWVAWDEDTRHQSPGVRQSLGRHRRGGAVRAGQQRPADLRSEASTPLGLTSRSPGTRRT